MPSARLPYLWSSWYWLVQIELSVFKLRLCTNDVRIKKYLLLVEVVVRANIIRNRQPFHFVDFGPTELISIFHWTFSKLLIQNGGINCFFNSFNIGTLLLERVSLVSVLVTPFVMVSQKNCAYWLIFCPFEGNILRHSVLSNAHSSVHLGGAFAFGALHHNRSDLR